MLRLLKKLINKFILHINLRGGLCGFYFVRDHFYQPIPNANKLLQEKEFFSYIYAPPGLELLVNDQLQLLEILSSHVSDFKTSPTRREGFFYTENGAFGYVDSMAYYGIISLFKPERIIEVGAGNSTLVALAAAEKLKKNGRAPIVKVIEPYPSPLLLENCSKFELLTAPVESVPFDCFEELEENDILFIDSSHIIKTRNDVVHLYLEVLPRLKKGVIVQIHDISLPFEIHPAIFRAGYYWNEQYLLMAILTHSTRYKILYAGYYMNVKHFDVVKKSFPDAIEGKSGGSFWLQVIS